MEGLQMRKLVGGCAGALALTVMLGIGSANAHSGFCEAEFDNLRTAIDGADFKGKNAGMTQSRLRTKADNGQTKLNVDKFGDSILKLENMIVKVDQLVGADKPKLDAGDGADILLLIDAAIGCVEDTELLH